MSAPQRFCIWSNIHWSKIVAITNYSRGLSQSLSLHNVSSLAKWDNSSSDKTHPVSEKIFGSDFFRLGALMLLSGTHAPVIVIFGVKIIFSQNHNHSWNIRTSFKLAPFCINTEKMGTVWFCLDSIAIISLFVESEAIPNNNLTMRRAGLSSFALLWYFHFHYKRQASATFSRNFLPVDP